MSLCEDEGCCTRFRDSGSLNFTILLPTTDYDLGRQLEVVRRVSRHGTLTVGQDI